MLIPDDTRQLFVEVDASDTGVGAVLSQRADSELCPCAFFSHWLNPTERNHDKPGTAGNQAGPRGMEALAGRGSLWSGRTIRT